MASLQFLPSTRRILFALNKPSRISVNKPLVYRDFSITPLNMSSSLTQKMSSLLTTGRMTESLWDHTSISDLSGKVYIVTGGSKGIGYGIISALLSHNPKKVFFVSSREGPAMEKLEALKVPRVDAEGNREGGPEMVEEKVEWVKCDLDDLKEVDRVSLELKERLSGEGGRLDGFVANAGIGIGKYRMSKDGIESHFQINHLSHMYMILTLLPILRDTSHKYKTDVRLVIQASENHRLATSANKFASLDEINTDVGAAELYNRSKLAQVCFMHSLIRRLEKNQLPSNNCPIVHRSGIIVNVTHPGVVWTDQMQQMEEAWGMAGKALTSTIKPISKDPVKEGCLSALYALTSPEIVSKDGGIYGQYICPPNKISSQSNLSQDVGLQENLWSLSVGLLKDKLGKISN